MWKCDVEFTDFEKRLRPDSQMSFCFKGIEYYISDMRNQAFLRKFFLGLQHREGVIHLRCLLGWSIKSCLSC